MLRGLVLAGTGAELTAVVNTGDDIVLHGLHVSPDIDTVTYTLAGLNDDERGWGLAGETWTVMEHLERLGGETWFSLGDRDLATHLYRTQRLRDGVTLSDVTGEIGAALGVGIRLLPMSDDPVRTWVTLQDGNEISFQDYFVRRQHAVAVRAVRFEGSEAATAAPGVLAAIADASLVIVCPSNPIVSIGPMLAVPGVADALTRRRDEVVAVSPIVAGAALKGPADRMLIELGHEATAVGVARLYAPLAATLVIDVADAALAADVERCGMRCVVADTVMRTPDVAAALAVTVLDASPAPGASRTTGGARPVA